MHFASALSQFPSSDRAVAEVVETLGERLAGEAPDLVCLFVSAHHEAAWEGSGQAPRRRVPGFSAARLQRPERDRRRSRGRGGPGLAAFAARLPGVRLHPFHVGGDAVPDLPLPEDADVLLLADPFHEPMDALMRDLDGRFSGTKVGGVASGSVERGGNRLWLADGSTREGVVAVGLTGDVRVDAVVAQGCRPVATRCSSPARTRTSCASSTGGRPSTS